MLQLKLQFNRCKVLFWFFIETYLHPIYIILATLHLTFNWIVNWANIVFIYIRMPKVNHDLRMFNTIFKNYFTFINPIKNSTLLRVKSRVSFLNPYNAIKCRSNNHNHLFANTWLATNLIDSRGIFVAWHGACSLLEEEDKQMDPW